LLIPINLSNNGAGTYIPTNVDWYIEGFAFGTCGGGIGKLGNWGINVQQPPIIELELGR
jgi:hypothetical protein